MNIIIFQSLFFFLSLSVSVSLAKDSHNSSLKPTSFPISKKNK